MNDKMKNGFTLIELVIVIAIVGILSVVGVYSYNSIMKNARDSKRISDLKEIQIALENYKAAYGTYPLYSQIDHDICGWDASEIGSFIAPLLTEGFLKMQPRDPNPQVESYCGSNIFGYRYYRYLGSEASSMCGRPHYILAAHMENSGNADVSQEPDCYAQKGTQAANYFGIGGFE